MNLNDAISEMHDLEFNLGVAVAEFEKMTGLEVHGIDISRADITGFSDVFYTSKLGKIRVDARLPDSVDLPKEDDHQD